MTKILTISIAAYNVGDFIDQSLESICKSSYLDYIDVLVQTNGANDDTSMRAKKWEREHPGSIRVIDVPRNHGYGFTINNSVALAIGKYFKQLDGDDWFDTKELDELVSFLLHTDEDAIMTDYRCFYMDSGNSKLCSHPYEKNVRINVSEIVMYSMHSLTIKTSLIKNPNLVITENCFYTDVEFFIRSIDRINSFVYLPFCVYIYRWNREGQSMSYQSIVKHIDEHELVSKTCVEIVRNSKKTSGLKESIEAMAIKHLGYLLCCPPNKNNKQKFINYMAFLSANDIDYKKKYNFPTSLALFSPRFFYKMVSLMKRKKYKIKN